MARVSITSGEVSVQLSMPEKIGALRGDIRFPRSAVRTVRVVDEPFAEIGGIRSPGTRIPGVMALGTWRLSGGREFVAVYRGDRGVVLDLDTNHAAYQRIILSTKDPDGIRRVLAALG
jgi:hypothetical protein